MIEITIPSPGESITQVQVARWLVQNGEPVEKDQEIVEIDSEKATFPLSSPADGIITILVAQGETAEVGAVIARVEEKGKMGQGHKGTGAQGSLSPVTSRQPPVTGFQQAFPSRVLHHPADEITATPLARKIIQEKNINADSLAAAFPGKRITRKEIELYIQGKKESKGEFIFSGNRTETRKKLSTLRIKLAERLVSVKNETAMLTTFNEINMRQVLEIKERYQDVFKEKFGVGLGLMSFFVRAVTLALQEFPQVNSQIDGEELVVPDYVDMGIAVSAPKGLMVPVIRNTESLGMAEIEIRIKEMAVKARENRITIDDMKGGTFTISNGGVFGSLLSTPILNPPQSGILGMHKIIDRPIAVNGKVEVHPMMYVALTYDHRVIDGRESVSFLVKVKEMIEEPARMLTAGEDLYKVLLDILTKP